MRPLRTALLGFGHVAEHGHLPAWRQRRDFCVIAVAEPDPGRRAVAQRLLPEAAMYSSAAELFAAEAPEVVDIAAPPTRHASLAVAAARAGAHVLCEKPLTTSLPDFIAMRDAAATAGVTLYTVHNWKHAPQFVQLAALLRDGAVGQPAHIRLETIRIGRAVSVGGEWRADAALSGGGILVDHGWHALYLLLGLAGERPERVRATTERRRYTTDEVEDTASCTIDFPSQRGEIFLTWAGESRRTRWQVSGSEGTVALADDRGEWQRNGDRRELEFARSLSAGSHHPDWFGAVVDDFALEIGDAARRGRNLAEAECCLVLLTLAYRSAAHGGRSLTVDSAAIPPGSTPLGDVPVRS